MSNDSSNTTPKPAVSYGPWWAVFITFLAYFVGSSIVVGSSYILYMAISGANATKTEEVFLSTTLGQFATVAGAYAGMSAVIYLFLRYRKTSLRAIGLPRGPRFKDFGWALLALAVYLPVSQLILQAVAAVNPVVDLGQRQQLPFDDVSGPGIILIFIGLAILPALVEEIMIRGFLYSGLRQRTKIIPAAFLASFLFGIAHLQFNSGAPLLYTAATDTFILSIFLIALREKTGSLWSSIFMHGLKNGLAFLAIFVFNFTG